MLTYVTPEEAGFDAARLQRAYLLLDQAAADGRVPAAALLVGRGERAVAPYTVGRLHLDHSEPAAPSNTIFLVASITKPVTATAVMMLVERGLLMLTDRVSDIIPEFAANGKEDVRVRHLLTHSSGLPDMLPDNVELRREHAPLSKFVERICALPLDFAPGTRIQYQSTGIAILGEIVERLTGQSLPDFLRREVFDPLRMHDTGLGMQGLDASRIAEVNVPPEQRGESWGWNQAYWRNFGAPWGGMFTSAGDLYRFCRVFTGGGQFDGTRLLSPATVAEMTSDQTTGLMQLMHDDYRRLDWGQTWGLGWTIVGRRVAEAGRTFFGDLCSSRTFGHGGATGTVVWIDPERDVVCVLFTTEPTAGRSGFLGRVSNLVAAAAI